MNEITLAEIFDRMEELPEFLGKSLHDVNVIGNFGNFPIHVAAGWGDVSVILELARNGADVNAKGEEGLTPLHRAAAGKHLFAVAALVDLGAELKAIDFAGQTALDLAKHLGAMDIVDYLVRENDI